jgi:hypothetical protein
MNRDVKPSPTTAAKAMPTTVTMTTAKRRVAGERMLMWSSA